MRNWNLPVRLGLLLPLILTLTGCLQTTRTAGTDLTVSIICKTEWRPQSYSTRDTVETQREAIGGNASRRAICGDT